MSTTSQREAKPLRLSSIFTTTVMVAALGYFVDIYDLVLFSIVRVASLRDLGVPEEQLLPQGVFLINMQMFGMLLGGIFWGVLGDKRGRLSVLFGSIVMYSLANIANAFVTSVEQYAALRLIAGIGLAGELGAAVTLVSETMPKEIRGYGTSVVAGIGVAGAILAALVARYFDWKTAYIVGGAMGLLLLALRASMLESGMFDSLKQQSQIARGNFLSLFTDRARFKKYLCCILIGMPTWYVVGILITFSPELCKAMGATGPVSAGTGILWCYGGLIVGDFGSGIASQLLKSRKKVVFLFVSIAAALCVAFLQIHGMTPEFYYGMAFVIGIFVGYWAIFVQIAAEQFGTNLRATVATTAPNFVRGSVVVVTTLFQAMKGSLGLVNSAMVAGVICFGLVYLALRPLQESFGRDLDFVE